MIVFTVLFRTLMGKGREPSPDGVPYPVSTYCAMLPWQFFARALTASSNSLVENRRLISKVYFPRLLVPFSSIIASLLDFAIALVILFALMAYYRVTPTWGIVTLPAFLLFCVVASLGLGLWLSALNVLYRDIRQVVPFAVQFGMFVTPVVYDAQSMISHWPRWAQVVYMLNPMAGVAEGFRWALLGAPAPPMELLAASALGMVAVFIGGTMYFRRMERTFADWV